MPSVALADLLPDFGARASTARNAPNAFVAREPSHPPAENIEEIVARRVAEAEAEITARLAREYEEKLDTERRQHATDMESMVARVAQEAAETIAARFSEMERDVTSLTTALTARILGMALTEDLRKRAVDELARIISEALGDRETLRIRLRGPEALGNALREKLGEQANQIDFSEAPGIDLVAEIDESLFETRIAEWSEALAEVLS